MLPILKLVADGQEYKYRDLIESLANEFQVTDEERKELLASGNQRFLTTALVGQKHTLKKLDFLTHLNEQLL